MNRKIYHREYMRKWSKTPKGRLYLKTYRKQRIKNDICFRTLLGVINRCTSKCQTYFKKGIKNYLNLKDIRYLYKRDKAVKLKFPSIHRKNPKKHYTVSNCKFVELKDNKSGKFGKWTKKYKHCLQCKTTKTKHGGHGLCSKCYRHKRWVNKRR